MGLKFFGKQRKSSKGKVKNEREVINAFFFKPLETLRFLSPYNGELKATIIGKASEKFGIVERAIRDRIDKVIETDFYTFEADGKIYKNNELFERLQAYFLPLFPKRERLIIQWMLHNNSNEVGALKIARSVAYTRRINDAIRKEFEGNLGQKTMDELENALWSYFEEDRISKNLSTNITEASRVNNKKEVTDALFKKPLEVMRILNDHEIVRKASFAKEVSEKFDITYKTAMRHVNKITKLGMLIESDKKEISKNPKLTKWFWSYLLPFYEDKERECLKIMLLGLSTKFSERQLDEIKAYTKRIEKLIRKEFAYALKENGFERISTAIWKVFRTAALEAEMF